MVATDLQADTRVPERSADLFLRSDDAAWNRARWERLPNDGNRYEVIDGVLYMSTAPSTFHFPRTRWSR